MKNPFLRRSLTSLVLGAFICTLNTGAWSPRYDAGVPPAATRAPVRGRHAMVASQHELASKIGVEVLKKGGNAVDAAIAVGIALAVVYPEAGNLGGGGFMLIRRKDGQAFAIDYRE